MSSFTYQRQVSAPPEIVFDVLTDHRGYARITPLRRVELERQGEPPPNGVGAIRVLRLAGPPLREEVVAYQPPRRFSYRLLSGLPVRDHLGSVSLEPVEGGTHVTYAVRATPTVPLGGAVLALIEQAVGTLLRGVAKESERRAAGNG